MPNIPSGLSTALSLLRVGGWGRVSHPFLCLANRSFCGEADNGMNSQSERFPSDIQQEREVRSNQRRRSQSAKSFRPKVDPSKTSVLLFPGQGSQFVGMGKKLAHMREVVDLYDEASEILGYDLSKVCLEGPVDQLNRTEICQPAILVTSLAALTHLQQTNPEALDTCVAAAGFSLGEYTALVMAGVLNFQDAVRLVAARGRAMQAASDAAPSGLLTVFLSHTSMLKTGCEKARHFCSSNLEEFRETEPVLSLSTYLAPEIKVIGGHQQALDFIAANAHEFHIRRFKPVQVSGAFHTHLMQPAVGLLKEALNDVELRRAKVPVHSNVDASMHSSPTRTKKLLLKQLTKPVRWEQILHSIYERKTGIDFPKTYEVGPGTQLGITLRAINRKAYESVYTSIDV